MRYLSIILTTLVLSSCANLPFSSNSDGTSATQRFYSPSDFNSDYIVQNLVYTLSQLPDIHPRSTTVQVKEPKSALSAQIVKRLMDAGYGVEYVSENKGMFYVKHAADSSFSDEGNKTTYRISIGRITVERDYEADEGNTYPGSEMRILGATEQDIVLNDDVFGETYADTQYKEAYFDLRDNAPSSVVDTETGAIITATNDLPSPEEVQQASYDFRAKIQDNVRDLMRSNYSSLFEEYKDVNQNILIFPNDSLRIGDTNKDVVKGYISDFNPDTDIISVIGCSHGNTKIAQGNQLLALGRANRVKEALIFAGINHNSILSEGCWDKKTFDEFMPRRGVVLTHKRRLSAG